MSNLVVEYDSYRLRKHPVDLAVFLFYEVISIHPFLNGNGRLCRLLLTWSLMRDGFPFPVTFSSGHSRRRKHYIHAIKAARVLDGGSRAELNDILIASLERTIANYEDHQRRIDGHNQS